MIFSSKWNIPFLHFATIIFVFNFNSINSSLKFPVKHKRERCFIEDTTGINDFLIKYHVTGFDEGTTEEEEIHVLENFRINAYKDGNFKVPFEIFTINNKKGKIALQTKDIKELKLCVKYENGISRKVKNHFDLTMSIKFSSNIEKEIDTESALKKDSIASFRNLAENIGSIVQIILSLQKVEIEQEDDTAKDIIFCGNLYYYLGIIQITIIIGISILHVFNFRKMLFQQKVI